ncbi:MAG: arsenic efflux protein [Firmicutes bacterium]|nr:arsenic efflux protein [Bacillota bacterium]
MLHEIIHLTEHILHHNWSLLPLLFVTYLVMGILEHTTGDHAKNIIQKTGASGPIWGSLLGIIPQCGFSAAASYFYVGRVVTMGTLIAVYMSTSDEMLPIMISEQVPPQTIAKILAGKVVIGIITGFLVEIFFGWYARRKKKPRDFVLGSTCGSDCCATTKAGIAKTALVHTVKVFFFIFIISIAIELIIHHIGEDALAAVFVSVPVVGQTIAAVMGLVPNCASSVVITQLYLDGIIGAGPMMSGLLVSAGMGLLVLFEENRHLKENLMITGILLGSGIAWGCLIEFLGITF